jgi:copper chaperone
MRSHIMTTLSVPDISCGHCRASIQTALAAVPDTGRVDVDLTTRRVTVAGPASPNAIIAALATIGFPAQVQPDL